MTRTKTRTADPRTVQMPAQEPVGIKDHPLSPSHEVPQEAGPPSTSAEEAHVFVSENPLNFETGFDDEGIKEAGSAWGDLSLSEQDKALSDGDESSYGDSSNFAATPNLGNLVQLGSSHCRSPCRITNKDGVKTPSVCGVE
jgi:hypothetical protein